ncbi:uncharacterized protein BJX67DRAFT_377912 [Aspergillus lucknowensis]|uniref:Uncharacterized protein n=1 Tax=Aspergillus lucknowensis TaxID=176173 RepID=A0ABR4M1Q4_9EURO
MVNWGLDFLAMIVTGPGFLSPVVALDSEKTAVEWITRDHLQNNAPLPASGVSAPLKPTATRFLEKNSTFENMELFPRCYICASYVDDEGNPRLRPRVCRGEEMMADKRFWRNDQWWRYYRLILCHPKKQLCQLSGIAFFRKEDVYRGMLRAPWNKDTGIILSDRMGRRRLARARIHESCEPPPEDLLTGFLVHARCWDLLCTHKIWRLADGNMDVILGALRRKSARDWTEPDDSGAWAVETEHGGRLPTEVLVMVADHLASQDASAVQKAIGCYLGDTYWRSRTPSDIFHEVRALYEETLDWEYLCNELERFKAYWDDELQARQWVLEQLDEIAELMDVTNSCE